MTPQAPKPRIAVSPAIAPRGWMVTYHTARIQAENLATLCAGGSLLECEYPYAWHSGMFLYDGVLVLHPREAQRQDWCRQAGIPLDEPATVRAHYPVVVQ